MRSFALWLNGAEHGALDVAHPMQLPPLDLALPSEAGSGWVELPGPAADWMLAPDAMIGYIIKARCLPPAVALDIARGERWDAAKAVRDARMQGGCTTQWGRVDTTDDSQRKIVGAATAAGFAKAAGQSFEVNWTMADNAVVALDADALIAVGMAVVAHLAACQDAGTAIRAAIDAAQDEAAVAAIDITAGYPS